jgi:polyphenol oxidase
MWLNAPNISVKHGFSTRHGGVSGAPFHSLNLGGSEDDPIAIAENQRRAIAELGLDGVGLCRLKQIHGNEVRRARPGIQTGDALVTADEDHLLVVSAADCYPILFHDDRAGVIGAAHAGWRGTIADIVGNVVREMCSLGSSPHQIKVAIGPGISMARFPVGHDVLELFRKQKFSEACFDQNRIDLAACNAELLMAAGITPDNIFKLQRCTTEPDFFSYRRDNGSTGRMWGLISLK